MEEGGFGGVCSQGPVEHFLDLVVKYVFCDVM